MELTRKTSISWQPGYRVIPSRFPTINLFDRVADTSEFNALYELIALTNPRIRDELGQICLVPDAEKKFGNGSGPIMAAFCHLNPHGSRFSDGRYGVFYAALDKDTSIAETAHHLGRFLSDSSSKPGFHQMRLLTVQIDGEVDELVSDGIEDILDPNSYIASQKLGAQLRAEGSLGLVYPSVRNHGKPCLAAFRTSLLNNCLHAAHYMYHFDGNKIDHIQQVETIQLVK